MKKIIFLISLLIALVIAGCNQKDLVHQIDGTWHVQKYTVNGADQTTLYDSAFAGFIWNFSGTANFYQQWHVIGIYTLYNLDTVASVNPVTHTLVIDSVITTIARVPTDIGKSAQGNWYLTNGNQFLETIDPVYGTRLYQILDHSPNSLHLLYNNQEFYLSK